MSRPPRVVLLPPVGVVEIVDQDGRRPVPAADALGWNRLRDALAGRADVDVGGAPTDAPEAVLIVDARRVGELDAAQRARTVLLDADRTRLPAMLDELGLAGAVESARFRSWRTRPQDEGGGGLVGRRDLAAALGASCGTGMFASPAYGPLHLPSARDLVDLLVSYAAAISPDPGG